MERNIKIKRVQPQSGTSRKKILTRREPSPKIRVGVYTGSPDSERVAQYIGKFEYHPEKRQEILEKYENLRLTARG